MSFRLRPESISIQQARVPERWMPAFAGMTQADKAELI
jgi:hypothetical protein